MLRNYKKLLIVIGLGAIACVVVILVASQAKQQPPSVGSQGPGATSTQPEDSGKEPIYSCRGEIVSIKPQEIQVRALKDFNNLEKDIILTVKITENTRYTRVKIDSGNKNKIGFSDLKIGDSVFVKSTANIGGKKEFNASEISVIIK